jgi:uracil phosphoribosyltransferase
MIHHLSPNNSLLSQYLSEIRDINIHKNRMRFRRNLERMGEIMAYEISKTVEYKLYCMLEVFCIIRQKFKIQIVPTLSPQSYSRKNACAKFSGG